MSLVMREEPEYNTFHLGIKIVNAYIIALLQITLQHSFQVPAYLEFHPPGMYATPMIIRYFQGTQVWVRKQYKNLNVRLF